ncbi:hypothetical protein Ae201684_005417 [Aphanomyces euteiches]|uniref:Uncharacterized protein n=1 Tax=Aphanomyces euteiches TaxID=100861 RepID=A0A6G0XEX2_9STRA|nr:hypothetical protein Ae201684_005417 [Aphanomyces euteiches]
MARVEGYRCPITIRTTSIQPYDLPRFVSDIIAQLHEISHWTTRCCAVINQPAPLTAASVIRSTITPKENRVPTTILTEMDLIKRNLTVVEKQQNTRLLSEIAYLQCALRSEAEEKMTDFEHFVEAKISQCVEEHTKQLRQQQAETAMLVSTMQDAWRSVQDEMLNLTQRLNKIQATIEMTTSRTVDVVSQLKEHLTESSKLHEKTEFALGNQVSQTRLQLQEMSMGIKSAQDQLNTRVDIIRNEVKYSVDQVRSQLQHHARVLNRVSRGSNLFEMMTPAENTSPKSKLSKEAAGLNCGPRLKRPVSARPSVSQPAHVQPASQPTNLIYSNTEVVMHDNEILAFDVLGKMYQSVHPSNNFQTNDELDGDRTNCASNSDEGLRDVVGQSHTSGKVVGNDTTNSKNGFREVPPCYILDEEHQVKSEVSMLSPQLCLHPTSVGKNTELTLCDNRPQECTPRNKAPSTKSPFYKKKDLLVDSPGGMRRRLPQRPKSARAQSSIVVNKAI